MSPTPPTGRSPRPLGALLAACLVACAGNDSPPMPRAEQADFARLFQAENTVRLQTDGGDPVGQVSDLQPWGGGVVLVDEIQSNVKVFALDGRLLRVIGRAGSGPGEFRAPFRAAPLADGRLAVLERPTLRVSFFGPDGSYRTGWHLPGIAPGALVQVPETSELLVMARLTDVSEADRTATAYALHTYTLDGKRMSSFRTFPELENLFEGNFDSMLGTLVGHVAVSAIYSRNRVYHRDLRSGREWETTVGEGIWTPPDWPKKERFGSLSELQTWALHQTWAMRLVPLDHAHYAVRFTRYDPETKVPTYQYAVVRASDGTTRFTTGPTDVDLMVAADGQIYGTRMDEEGEVDLLVLRMNLGDR